jgi:membrane fusion protein (multidrug efflux system)
VKRIYHNDFLVTLLLTIAGLIGCSGQPAADQGTPTPVPEVTVTQVKRGDIAEILRITGTIAALPNQDVKIPAQVAGRVTEMRVAEGDRVNAGQLLAKIDDTTYRDQLAQAAATEAQARANLENARLNHARSEDLFKRGIASRKEVEDTRTQESVAQATVAQAQAAVSAARIQVSRTNIHSPIAGLVVKRFVNVGEQVDGTAAQPVVEVASYNEVELLGNVPAAYMGKLRTGQSLTISSDAFPGKTFTGRVVAISPAVDPATNAGLVRIRFANPVGLLRLGMVLTTQAPADKHSGALIVPPQSIYRDEQGTPHVYKVSADNAEAVSVTLGIQNQDAVELLSGIQAGDTVIVTGGYGLPDKAKVRVKNAAPANSKGISQP